MAGILYPEQTPGVLAPATVNPLLLRQVQAQRAANPRPNVTDLFGYGPDLSSYASNLSRNFAGQFEGLGTPQNFMGPFGFGGITAFHGSPHRFDKFDMSKVGTGEGAQAYGHGLYFAENPAVAQDYARAVTTQRLGLGTLESVPYSSISKVEQAALADLKLSGGDANKAIERLKSPPKGYEQSYSERRKVLEDIAAGKRSAELAKGNLYKVDIPDDQVAKMLDWDKPLSQQPESVRKALEPLLTGQSVKDDLLGHQLYDAIKEQVTTNAGAMPQWAQKMRAAPDASAYLRQLGIPGIKYLDQGSRSGGKGTSNFVVFDDQIPKIIGRE
jgi:hypothetical protein